MRRVARALSVAVLLTACAVAPAVAQSVSPTPIAEPRPADQVVLTGRVVVPRGQAVGEVVVFHGRALIAGVVHGDVVVLDGAIDVSGQVSGSVVALHGTVTLARTAQVGRDVIAGDTVSVTAGAQVGGTVRQQVRFTLGGSFALAAWILTWLAVSASTLLLGMFLLLVAPRGVDRVEETARSAPWASIGFGLGASVLIPVASVALVATLLGLPLGIAVLLALALLLLAAYALSAVVLGRALVKPPRGRALAFLAGWAILRGVGLIPVVSGITFGLGAVFGLGALTVATWRARGRSGRHGPGAPAPVPIG